jgi:hypothetical protein
LKDEGDSPAQVEVAALNTQDETRENVLQGESPIISHENVEQNVIPERAMEPTPEESGHLDETEISSVIMEPQDDDAILSKLPAAGDIADEQQGAVPDTSATLNLDPATEETEDQEPASPTSKETPAVDAKTHTDVAEELNRDRLEGV